MFINTELEARPKDAKYAKAAEIDWQHHNANIIHGEEGHRGFRCGRCAALAVVPVLIESTSGDHWQTKQIAWQEECDVVFRAFDDAVAEHLPIHIPAVASGPNAGEPRCETCPTKPDLPIKPIKPYERQ